MTDESADYDEFAMLKVYADYEGIPWQGQPEVARHSFDVGSGRQLSALVWGTGDPEIVLVHGVQQNAHTWDSVAMALDLPLIAVDLPGHGHSDWRDDHDYSPRSNAEAIASLIRQAAPNLKLVVGMSLGGMTTLRLAAAHPELVPRAVIVDITPGVVGRLVNKRHKQDERSSPRQPEPQAFDTFDELLERTAAGFPDRPIESLRIGVRHNSQVLDDGRWSWRYDTQRSKKAPEGHTAPLLWDELASVSAPLMLVRGGKSPMVQDEDVAEFLRRQPKARIELVEGAAHNVQSDRPTQLAALIRDFLATTA